MMAVFVWAMQADPSLTQIVDLIWKSVGILGILGGGIAIGRLLTKVDTIKENISVESKALREEIDTNTLALNSFAQELRAKQEVNADKIARHDERLDSQGRAIGKLEDWRDGDGSERRVRSRGSDVL